MRKAEVYRNGVLAGILAETEGGTYVFTYDSAQYLDHYNTRLSMINGI